MKGLISFIILMFLIGCSQNAVVPLNSQTGFDDAPGLERQDFDQLTPAVVEDMLLYAWYSDFVKEHNRLPVIHQAAIENQTPETLDLFGLKQSMQQALLSSGNIILVDNQSVADYSMTANITLEHHQTEAVRRSVYLLSWTLTASTMESPVWTAVNRVEKVQHLRRF